MGSTAKLPKITKAELEEFLRLETERKELEQKARAIAKRTKALNDHFKAHLEAAGKMSLKRLGYQLTLIKGPPKVSWKSHFIEKCGPLAADELTQNAPKSTKVDVQAG